MTELLKQALQAVRRESPEVQDRIADAILSLVMNREPEPINPAHREAVMIGVGQLRRGEYASEEEIAAALRSFDQ